MGRKQVFEGWTLKDYHVLWTVYNTLNFAFIVQKTPIEAALRYMKSNQTWPCFRDVTKIRITIEELADKRKVKISNDN